jgi:uncharacterized protein (DUF1800 family)
MCAALFCAYMAGMISVPTLAALRFGTGLAPDIAPPGGPSEMLAALRGPDGAAAAFPVGGWRVRVDDAIEWITLRRKRRDSAAADAAFQTLRRRMADNYFADLGNTVARGTRTGDGFRERLVWFWADHFTIAGGRGYLRQTLTGYVEDAVRPRITGRFSDLLIHAVTHPAMLVYLDQSGSVGPGSPFAQRRTGRGLNENLAREVLELHTMGVGAAYGQGDVRALAELLTGLGIDKEARAVFRPNTAEPGAEVVLGQVMGGDPAQLEHIHAALRVIAAHPDTARHIARKLAVHFVSDTPAPDMVDAMTRAYQDTDGALMAVYGAMLNHPAAWGQQLEKVRQPFDFIVAGLRALGLGDDAGSAGGRVLRETVLTPLQLMGQPWQAATGPDGWPEEAAAWITPQGLAARIDWAMTRPEALVTVLPDPRDFVEIALADAADGRVRFAAEAAETRAAGVGLILASAAFQRR